MSFTKHNFNSGDTLYAAQLNEMEDELVNLGMQLKSVGKVAKFDKVLLFYGHPNSINNSWDVNNSANIYSKYDICIFGDGYCVPTNEAYIETKDIFARLKEIAPATRLVGYVPIGVSFVESDSNLPMSTMKQRVDYWKAIGAHGIFLDEFGYDYGVTRARQNEIVKYCHDNGLFVFANSWSTDYCFSKEDIELEDLPNFHPNPDGTSCELNDKDYYLYEHLFWNSYIDWDSPNREIKIEGAEVYRLEDIIRFYTEPQIDGQSYYEAYGTKVCSLDSIPSTASIKEKNKMLSLSLIGAAMFSINAIAFGDENWGSEGYYHDWDFPLINLKTVGINGISREYRTYMDDSSIEQEFPYKWTSNINGLEYTIVFDITSPADLAYREDSRYVTCNGVKVDDAWLNIYNFQDFLKETEARCDGMETQITDMRGTIENAMPTVVNAEERMARVVEEASLAIGSAGSDLRAALGDVETLTAGFQYVEREW